MNLNPFQRKAQQTSTRNQHFLVVSGGPGLSSSYLREPLSFLNRHFRCTFYDQLGCGSDTTPYASISADSTSDQFHDLIQSCAEPLLSIVTHSWGSHVVLRAIQRDQNIASRIRSIIMINPTPITTNEYNEAGSALVGRISSVELKKIESLISSQREDIGQELMDLAMVAYTGSKMRTPHLVFQYSPRTAQCVTASLGDFDFIKTADKIGSKLTLITGDDDYISPSTILTLKNAASHHHAITAAGHFPFSETPQDFQRLFMESVN